MSSGRDAIWDAATWADIDQAVLDTANQVRVARKIFRTDTAGPAGQGSVSGSEIVADEDGLSIPDHSALPMVEIWKMFYLSPTQAETEANRSAAQSLATAAARDVAIAEDRVILCGMRAEALPRGASYTRDLQRGGLIPERGVRTVEADQQSLSNELSWVASDEASTELSMAAVRAHVTINDALNGLAANSWGPPYAIVLGAKAYATVWWQTATNSGESPGKLLANRVSHILLSTNLEEDSGLVLSLAGQPGTIYVVDEISTTCVGQHVVKGDVRYGFRVAERIQFVMREPSSIKVIAPTSGQGAPATKKSSSGGAGTATKKSSRTTASAAPTESPAQ